LRIIDLTTRSVHVNRRGDLLFAVVALNEAVVAAQRSA
jgi:hypothetical protein